MKNPPKSEVEPNAPTGQLGFSSRRLLSEPEAALYLGVSRSFLAKSRCKGGGCRFAKIGRRVGYDIRDLDEYTERSKRHSTSESAGA